MIRGVQCAGNKYVMYLLFRIILDVTGEKTNNH